MGNKPKMKMSPLDRAKQFAPFSALKGLEEALRCKEKVLVERAELSSEYKESISEKLKLLEAGGRANVVFFCDGQYVAAEGIVSKIDKNLRLLQIVKTEIKFEDIYKLSVEGLEDF